MKCKMCWKEIGSWAIVTVKDEEPIKELELCPVCAEFQHPGRYHGHGHLVPDKTSSPEWGRDNEVMEYKGTYPLLVSDILRLLKAGLTLAQIVYLRQEGII